MPRYDPYGSGQSASSSLRSHQQQARAFNSGEERQKLSAAALDEDMEHFFEPVDEKELQPLAHADLDLRPNKVSVVGGGKYSDEDD